MNPYRFVRPLLFRLDAEKAHDCTLGLLELCGKLRPLRSLLSAAFAVPDPALRVCALGLEFANPLGLAAGYDKDGRALHGLASLGFGYIELGTVTPAAQGGNPKPRIFRLPQDEALINRMGFPNEGAQALQGRLQRGRPCGIVLGVNIGKGADTPLERAADDYESLLRVFHPLADYLVINISSPNTVGLRRLQGRDYLEQLLARMGTAREELQKGVDRRVPILVKIAPDLAEIELEDAVGVIAARGMDGVIATNTTLARGTLRSAVRNEQGGLSGAPLHRRAEEVVRRIHALCNGRLPIIAVGGILSASDAKRMLDAGASLIQVYSGLVFRGPGLVKEILVALREQHQR